MNNSNDLLLEEIYKSAKMGMQATSLVAEKAENSAQRADIRRQHDNYHQIAESAGEHLVKKGSLPGENNVLEKAALWGSIQLNTLTGASPTRISEIIINGCNMGIVEVSKKMNDYREADFFAKELGHTFIRQSEEQIDLMKSYL